MAPKRRPKSAPRITARRVNSLILSSVEMNGRNSPGGAVELHGRSLKEGLPGPHQIGCVRDYAAREASGEANLGWESRLGMEAARHPSITLLTRSRKPRPDRAR